MDAPSITVTAARDGFRRGGRAWSTTPTTVPIAELDDDALDALRAEPSLVVVVTVPGEVSRSAVLTPETMVGPNETVDGPAVTVTAARDGFRRGGRAWSTTPTTVPIAELDEDALDALRAEPNLVVVEQGTEFRAGDGGDDAPRRKLPDGSGESGTEPAKQGVDPAPVPETGAGEPATKTPASADVQAEGGGGQPPPPSVPGEGLDTYAPIVAAIRGLDPDDPSNWSGRGNRRRPSVAALEAALGRDISAEQRDAAWAIVCDES